MGVNVELIKKAASKLIEDPEMQKAVKESVKLAKALQTRKFDVPGVSVKRGKETCGGCFTCLACGATPTPDLEAGCLLTAFYIGS